jgi:hypothetical protein
MASFMTPGMTLFRFRDEEELEREHQMIIRAVNQLVQPEPPTYSLCSGEQCIGGFISPRTARTLEWIADQVYDLLTVREATKGAGAALVDIFGISRGAIHAPSPGGSYAFMLCTSLSLHGSRELRSKMLRS